MTSDRDEKSPSETMDAESARAPGAASGNGSEAAPSPRRESRLAARVILAVLILGGTLGAGGLALAARDGCPRDGAAFEVEGRTITTEDLERRIEVLRALYGVRPPPESDGKANDSFRRDTAKAVAVSVVVERDVKNRNLQVADKAVRDALDRYIAQTFAQDGRDRFVDVLSAHGISEDQILDEFRRLLDSQRLFDAVTGNIGLNDEDVT